MKRLCRAACGILAMVFAMAFLTPCAPRRQRFTAVFTDVFDTVTELTAYCPSQSDFNELRDGVHDELLRLHKIFDIYSDGGGAYKLNHSGGEWVEITPELSELLRSAKEWHKSTGGQLNAAMGSVLSLWHECRENEILPDPSELTRRAARCDIDCVELDGGRARLTDTEMSVDLGALAKGYAAEVAADFAVSMGCEGLALSVGGNVVTRGEKPSGKWEIGVENPDGGLLTSVKISDCAVVTSGDYQRFFEVDGIKYHHIIDPTALYPARIWRSVTVICQSSADADALSTALFCLDFDAGKALLDEYGAEALWVGLNGEIARSEGFSDYEK